MVPLGLGQAVTVRVGRAHGAGDYEAVTRAGWTAYAMGVGFMALMAAVMILLPYPLISAFIDLDAPENATSWCAGCYVPCLRGLFQIVDGAQAVGGGMLRGLHDTTIPMIYALIGYWGVGLPLGVALAFPGGLEGTRHLDRPVGGAGGRGRAAARPLAATGQAGVDRAAASGNPNFPPVWPNGAARSIFA